MLLNTEGDKCTAMTPSEDTKYIQSAGCEVQHMPDGYVVYQSNKDKVHYLDPTASIIYELCSDNERVDVMVDYLQNAFSLPDKPVDEVNECISNLVKEGLIEPVAG